MNTRTQKTVVYLIRTLNLGGAERYLVETVTHLDRSRFLPKVYCIAGGGSQEAVLRKHGIEVTIFQAGTERSALVFLQKFQSVYAYLQRTRPDIVHAYMFTPGIYGGLAVKLLGLPKLVTTRMRLGIFKDARPHYQWVENWVNGFTDAIMANSQAVRADVLRRERIAAERVHVIYGGVDLAKYTKAWELRHDKEHRKHLKAQWGIPAEAPIVGMLGNLYEYKGYRELALAAAELHGRYPETRFVCIGEDRGFKRELERLAQEHKLNGRLMFTGMVEDVTAILPILDIQVLASHQEGFSSALLEGMAVGNPLVATRVGGNPEAVVHEKTGLLIPPKDAHALARALSTLLQNPERAAQFGRNGRQRVEEYFSLHAMVQQLETLYEDL